MCPGGFPTALAGASSTTHAYAMGGYNNSALQNMVNKFCKQPTKDPSISALYL